jgi:hypothetical protein
MKHGESLDKTSKKIINYMRENKIAEFSVHATKSAKQLISVKCPVSNTIVNMYVETAHMLEQHLIQMAYNAGETLPLCQEVKK